MATAGRKPLLQTDPELLPGIQTYIRAGAHPERAAVACGISERSHYAWQAKGIEEREHRDAGKPPRKTWQIYLDYVDAIDQATAEAEMVLITKIARGGRDWAASLALLERRFRDRWGKDANLSAGSAPPAAPKTGLDEFTKRRAQRRGSSSNG